MRLLLRSLEVARELGAEPELARTYEALGRQLREGGKRPAGLPEDLDAPRCFELARAKYRALDLPGDLRRLEALDLA
jgi:hypothetical protein